MYKLRTVAEHYSLGHFHPAPLEELVSHPYERYTAHEVAEYIAGMELVKSRLIAAGYKNPSISYYHDKSGSVCVLVDEDEIMYRPSWPDRRPSVTEVCTHTGMGMGCGNGYCSQLISFSTFKDWKGPDETHGGRGWTNAPCMQCFPAEYARRKAAGEIWRWPERPRPVAK